MGLNSGDLKTSVDHLGLSIFSSARIKNLLCTLTHHLPGALPSAARNSGASNKVEVQKIARSHGRHDANRPLPGLARGQEVAIAIFALFQSVSNWI